MLWIKATCENSIRTRRTSHIIVFDSSLIFRCILFNFYSKGNEQHKMKCNEKEEQTAESQCGDPYTLQISCEHITLFMLLFCFYFVQAFKSIQHVELNKQLLMTCLSFLLNLSTDEAKHERGKSEEIQNSSHDS